MIEPTAPGPEKRRLRDMFDPFGEPRPAGWATYALVTAIFFALAIFSWYAGGLIAAAACGTLGLASAVQAVHIYRRGTPSNRFGSPGWRAVVLAGLVFLCSGSMAVADGYLFTRREEAFITSTWYTHDRQGKQIIGVLISPDGGHEEFVKSESLFDVMASEFWPQPAVIERPRFSEDIVATTVNGQKHRASFTDQLGLEGRILIQQAISFLIIGIGEAFRSRQRRRVPTADPELAAV